MVNCVFIKYAFFKSHLEEKYYEYFESFAETMSENIDQYWVYLKCGLVHVNSHN